MKEELFIGFECHNPPQIDKEGKIYGHPIQYPDKEDLDWWIGNVPSGRQRFRIMSNLPAGWSAEDIASFLEREDEIRGGWKFRFEDWLRNTK